MIRTLDDEPTKPVEMLWCPQCGFPVDKDTKHKIVECKTCGYTWKTPNKPRSK